MKKREMPYDQLSRNIRILSTLFLTSVVAIFLAGALFTPVEEGHITYRAGRPIAGIFFFGIFWLGLVAAAAVVFFFVDEVLAKRGGISRRVNIVTICFLIVLAVGGFAVGVLGWFGIWFLLFWIVTGRILGRPGWSIETLRNGPWAERVYFVGMTSFLMVFAYLVLSGLAQGLYFKFARADLGEPAFQPRYERLMNFDMKRALLRFPDSQSCLVVGANASNKQDLLRMDWDKMRTSGDITVCTFRLLHDWGDVSEASAWMRAQGLRSDGGFSSDNPYETTDGTLDVHGTWSVKRNGPLSPTKGVLRRVLAAAPYATSLYATYSADGTTLLYVSYGSSTM